MNIWSGISGGLGRLGRKTGLLALVMLSVAALAVACNPFEDEAPELATGLEDRGYANTERLVTTQWIEDNLDNDRVLLLDVRKEEQYAEGHIPSAIRVTPNEAFQQEINGVAGLIPPASHVAGVLSSVGAKPDTPACRDRGSAHGYWRHPGTSPQDRGRADCAGTRQSPA